MHKPSSVLLALALLGLAACAPAPSKNVTAGLPATAQGQALAPLTGTPLAQPPEWARTDAPLPEGAAVERPAVILSNDDYRIGPSDEIEVSVFQVEELSGLRRVNSRGDIRMPLLGAVNVAGKSAQEVEDLLTELYGKDYLQDPQISVDVKLHASQQVTLFGAVQKPGVYPLPGRTTLLQALAMGGGINRVANQEEVVVFRTEPSGNVHGYLVNVDEIVSGAKADPEVIGSDRIVVPESGMAAFWRSFSFGIPGIGGYSQY